MATPTHHNLPGSTPSVFDLINLNKENTSNESLTDTEFNKNEIGDVKGTHRDQKDTVDNILKTFKKREAKTRKKNWKDISPLVKTEAATSILQLLLYFSLLHLLPQTFVGSAFCNEVLFSAIPVATFLLINFATGIICNIFVTLNFKFKFFGDHLLLITFIQGACTVISAWACVSFFATNVYLASELEEIMKNEVEKKGESSQLWTITQNFHQCCGIESYKTWDWNRLLMGGQNYPKSCCDMSWSRNYCHEPPSKNEVFRIGCLDNELDLLFMLGYSIFLLSVSHFFLSFFTTVNIARMHGRKISCMNKCKQECKDNEEKELQLNVKTEIKEDEKGIENKENLMSHNHEDAPVLRRAHSI